MTVMNESLINGIQICNEAKSAKELRIKINLEKLDKIVMV